MARKRISIDGHSFITDDIEQRLSALAGTNRELVVAVIATVKLGNEMASTLPAFSPHKSPEEKQKVIALVLLVRLIEAIEGILILAAYGVRQDLNSLFRIFLDAYFLVANVCSDPNFVTTYFNTDTPNRLKLINAGAKHDHEIFSRLNKYATDEMRTNIKKQIEEDKIQQFDSYLYAEKVGCAPIYDSMYRIASASVHTSPRCLEEYVEGDAQGNITKIAHRGDPQTAHRVLYDTSCFLLKALRGTCELFGHPESSRISQLEASLEVAIKSNNLDLSQGEELLPTDGANGT